MPQRKNRTVLVLSDDDLRTLCECLGHLIVQWERFGEEERVKKSGAAEHFVQKASACRVLMNKLSQALECQ